MANVLSAPPIVRPVVKMHTNYQGAEAQLSDLAASVLG